MGTPKTSIRSAARSQYSRLFSRLFFGLMSPYFSLRSGPIWVKGLASVAKSLDPSLPVLIYANHTSWFDGFLLMRLHQSLRPYSVLSFPMLHREWRVRRRVFSRLGAIPIADTVGKTRDAFSELERQRRVLNDKFTLFYLPQGEIWPATRADLSFKRGLEKLLPRLSPIQYFPAAIQFEMFNTPRPQLFLTLGSVEVTPKKTQSLEQPLRNLLDSTRAEIDALGERFAEMHSENWQKWSW